MRISKPLIILSAVVTTLALSWAVPRALANADASRSKQSSSQTIALQPDSALTVTCGSKLQIKTAPDGKSVYMICPIVKPSRTPTTVASPTKTAVPPTVTRTASRTPTRIAATATRTSTRINTSVPASATPLPTKTNVPPTVALTNTSVPPTITPTAHHHHPTETPTPGGGGSGSGLSPVPADILGTCPVEVHDRYVTTGPDGRTYRTWHPQEVPVDANNPSGTKCRFAHEHGDDPTTSLANPVLPPFGYIGYVSGHPEEAHAGFKVAVSNRGEVNDESRVMQGSARVVFHMGTGGVLRYTMPHHSAIVDIVMPTGQYIHVQGLFDTHGVGSICERDRNNNDTNFSNDIGRTVMTLPGTGCEVTSPYEIWSGDLLIRKPNGQEVLKAFVTMAVFDTITTMDPADKTRLIYTTDAFASRLNEAPFMGGFHGCDRENYHTAPYWYNANGPTVYFTDAFGNSLAEGAPGALRQEVSAHSQIGIGMATRSDGTLNQFKERTDYCGAGLGLKN